MSHAHQFKSGNFDIVVIKIGNVTDSGKVVAGIQVGGLPSRFQYLPVPLLSVPERFRHRFGDRDDGGVVRDDLTGVGLGPVGFQPFPPLPLALYHFLHDADGRVLPGHRYLAELQRGRFQLNILHLVRSVTDQQPFCMIPQVSHDDRRRQKRIGNGQRIPAVPVADGAPVGVFNGDIRRGKRFTGRRIGYNAANGYLGERRTCGKKKKQ